MIEVEDIYNAAFDRALFPALIERLVRAFDAKAGFIGWKDTASGSGFQAEFGNDPVWLQSYVETFAQHDILRPMLQAMPEGMCALAYPYLQTADVRESLFYREYLKPQGIVDNLAVNLIKRPGISAHLALLRCAPAPPFSTTDCDRLAALVPHLRRAVYVQSHLVRAADHSANAHVFAGANSYTVLLTGDRIVAEVDAPLSQLLGLRAGDTIGEGPLGKAIGRAIDLGEPMAVELAHGKSGSVSLLCEARPLKPNRFGDLSSGSSPTHAVHVARLDQPPSIAFEAIAALYHLTPTELNVLRDAIVHGDMTAIGDRLGMARATARTHLHRIYEKTRTRSFAGLSNLAHRFVRLIPEQSHQ